MTKVQPLKYIWTSKFYLFWGLRWTHTTGDSSEIMLSFHIVICSCYGSSPLCRPSHVVSPFYLVVSPPNMNHSKKPRAKEETAPPFMDSSSQIRHLVDLKESRLAGYFRKTFDCHLIPISWNLCHLKAHIWNLITRLNTINSNIAFLIFNPILIVHNRSHRI